MNQNKRIYNRWICFFIFVSLFLCTFAQKRLVILHTNDTHSRIDAFPVSDKEYAEKAGIINREAIIDSIRRIEKNVLLLDAGDFVQGTPYFNIFKGKVEAEALNRLQYDAVTLGNHEFDNGLDFLRDLLQIVYPPVVVCNYNFTGTVLEGKTSEYLIIKKDNIKIGITGIGVNPQGLVQKRNYEGMKYLPAIDSANKTASFLKNKGKCDLVVCISHIGYQEDIKLAEASRDIDIIIGGHSHTFMEEPDIRKNAEGKNVIVTHAGKNGLYIGKLEIELERKRNK
ncbi:MAG: metallophosphoesterase [Candidatus Azobacteroides sp.]|nr:metallophosphoesterase [Candidatus Azobacteroides sp.]